MTPAFNRRLFLQGLTAFGVTALTVPGAFAEELTLTPRQMEGPFYPDRLPLDTDNDLLIVNDKLTQAVGEITHLTGKVLDSQGKPIRNATVEIWQVDNEGSYLHSQGANRENENKRDSNFQGYGRFLTGSTGEYYFRTIKPVSYPGRSPHVHVIVKQGDKRMLTTQFYIKDHPANSRDFIVNSIRNPEALANIMVDFKPIPESKIGELAANFNIIIGTTPEDAEQGGNRPPGGRPPGPGNRPPQ